MKARVRTLCVNLAAAEIEGLRRLGRLSPIVAVRCTPAALMLAAAIVTAWTILVSASLQGRWRGRGAFYAGSLETPSGGRSSTVRASC